MQMDVILFPNSGLAGRPFDEILGTRFNLPVSLGRDVRLERLQADLAEQIMDACEPRGHNFEPRRQYGQLYSFVRENPPPEPPNKWDSDHRLQECVAMSRLVRPTSIGFEYSATLSYTPAGELASIIPGPVGGFGAQSWIVPTDHGDWLDEEDVAALRELWSQANLSSLPDRLRRALWYHEYAARTSQVAIRWVLLTTGIEALINTGDDRPSRQFVVRFCALAHCFGGIEVSRSTASLIYGRRSNLAHGEDFTILTENDRPLYSLLETVLRVTVGASLNDQAVQQLFSSSDEVKRQWPL